MIQSNEVAPGDHSCGARLKHAREAAGLSREDVGGRLKMPLRVVRALESDDWSLLGARVYVRGQLRSYARLLGVDLDIDSALRQVEPATIVPPELVSRSHTPRYQRVFEQMTRRVVYISITVAIALPVWIATRPHIDNVPALQPLETPVAFPGSEQLESSPSGNPARAAAPVERTPMVASMTSLPSRAAPSSGLSFSFRGESWVQVFARDGRALEQGMLGAGDRLNYAKGDVGRVVLGDSTAVDVRQAGQPVDLSPFSRAKVARFTLSSDGSLAPVVD